MMLDDGFSIRLPQTFIKKLIMEINHTGDSDKILAPNETERYEDRNFVDTNLPVWNYSLLYDDDIATFQNGTNYNLYKKFG